MGLARQLIENLFAFPVNRLLVRHDILAPDAAVLTDLSVRNGVFVQKLDQEGTRDIQDFSCLNSGQFRTFTDHRYPPPVSHGFQHMDKQLHRTRRKLDWVLLLVVSEAKRQGTPRPSVSGENLTGASCDSGISWRGRLLSLGCAAHTYLRQDFSISAINAVNESYVKAHCVGLSASGSSDTRMSKRRKTHMGDRQVRCATKSRTARHGSKQ